MCCGGKAIAGAIGLAKAALRLDRAPRALIEQRRALCRACPHARRIMHQGALKVATCMLCGCYLPAKTVLRRESCPLSKW